jgi:molecular chaperone GrpE (heat shock protein)
MFRSLINKIRPPAPSQADELAKQAELQALRLELESTRQKLAQTARELERSQANLAQHAREMAGLRIEAFLREVASPAAQLTTQSYLADVEGKTLEGRDVLAVGRALLRGLQNHGLQPAGQVGMRLSFDPNLHAPLSAQTPLSQGQAVIVRFVGYSFEGKVILKALVTPAEA